MRRRDGIAPSPRSSSAQRAARAARFAAEAEAAAAAKRRNGDGAFKDKRALKRQRKHMAYGDAIVGTSAALEKDFFRLTSQVDPSTVRPLAVLKRALAHVKAKWAAEEDYAFACEQLKSIRQDLTVQSIEDGFAAHVYATHARVALESGDLGEYNQCQTRLLELTQAGIASDCAEEFSAYRVLYALVKSEPGGVASALRRVDPSLLRGFSGVRGGRGGSDGGEDNGDGDEVNGGDDEDVKPVHHALGVVRAVHRDDYASFFRLYKAAPGMSGFLMDYLVSRMRRLALRCSQVAFCGPPATRLPLASLVELLAFASRKECRKFLQEDGAAFSKVPEKTDTDGRALVVLEPDRSAAAPPSPTRHISMPAFVFDVVGDEGGKAKKKMKKSKKAKKERKKKKKA
mmetsp:Transcript_969/g.2667  ORF Transcript_969/g.2667 Transcript_969/m.2667 type:complete len:400 (-) Transcript_969:93-1292(-)